MEAPRLPRIGSGSISVSWPHSGWLGSSLAKGTTSVPAGPDAMNEGVGTVEAAKSAEGVGTVAANGEKSASARQMRGAESGIILAN